MTLRSIKLAAIFAALGMAVAVPARADMEAGRAAFRAGDLPRALSEFRSSAEAGDAQAQFLVGQMLADGQGADKDVPQALIWLERAAAAGHVGAAMMAGTLYAHGDGVPADYDKAMAHLRPAAVAGDALAQNNLAVLLFYGLGTAQDPVRALAWAMRAEQSHLVQAINLRAEIEMALSSAQIEEARALSLEPLAKPAQAAVESEPVEPQAVAPRSAEPQTVEAEPVEPQTVEAAVETPQPEPAAPAAEPTPTPTTEAPAVEPASPPAEAGGWSVQVAALPSRAEAERQWAAIAKRQSALLRDRAVELRDVDLGEKGVFTRILVGRFSRERAETFCAQLKQAGQDCLIRRR